MGSNEEASCGQERWWESASLSPSNLRQHADDWNLASDSATASLLQSISQKLVSRTHEVEGMLQKVLEETDRVSAAIHNTSNSFHMLANTQFIENRTYQDDADVAKNKAPEPQSKPAVTEEEVIARCRSAIAAGLEVVNKNYERHEIHDSESEDEDGYDSPVPIYALIDPYEHNPLPYIIGSQAFMEDNRVGLQELSSEDNSKTTLTPEETESEDELDDSEAKKSKPIPFSSSKEIDDESDSELSDDSMLQPASNHIQNNIPRVPQTTSEDEDDDDDDDDFFKPSAKATQKLTSNGRNITDELNKKFDTNTSSSSSASKKNTKTLDFGSESDDDGDLFGRRPDRSSGMFESSQVDRVPRVGNETYSESLSKSADTKSRTGVENVRAMPDPKNVPASVTKRSTPMKNDLFGSDSDDDGELFTSKPRSSSKNNLSGSNIPASTKTPNPAISTPVPASGGLFSSDGDEEDDNDGGLFGSKSSSSSVLQGTKASEDEEPNKNIPAPTESKGRKVPVGGISIFSSAITSAIRKQKSEDSSNSDEGSDWGESKKPASVIKKQESVESSSAYSKIQEPFSVPKPAPPVTSRSAKGAGGLFDDDDDDDDLFGSKPKNTSSFAQKDASNSSLFSPSVADVSKKNVQNQVQGTTATSDSARKTGGGIFSDDDDDLFNTVPPFKNKPSTLDVIQSVNDSAITKKEFTNESDKAGALKPGSSDISKTSTPAVQIPDVSKTKSNALFSSPSDDDLFSPSVSQSAVTRTTKHVEKPPPLPTKAVKPNNDMFGSPSSDDDFFSAPKSVQPVKKSSENKHIPQSESTNIPDSKEMPPPLVSDNIFLTPSDDEDLFSAPPTSIPKINPSKGNVQNKHSETASPKSNEKAVRESNTKLLEAKVPPSKDDKSNQSKTVLPKLTENSVSESKINLRTSIPNIGDDKFVKENKISEAPSSKQKIEDLPAPSFEGDLFKSDKTDSSASFAKVSIGPKPPTQSIFLSPDDDDDDIFSGLTAKSTTGSVNSSSARYSATKSSIFNLSDSDEDIFSTGSLENKRVNNHGTNSDKSNLVGDKTEDGVINNKTQQLKQNILPPFLSPKPFAPTLLDDRESPPPFSVESDEPQKLDRENRVSVDSQDASAKIPQSKPPFGGVALFGGDELAAKINNRKSVLDEDTSDSHKCIEVNNEIPKVESQTINANDAQEDDIFGLHNSDNDDIFNTSYQTQPKSINFSNRMSPPPLPSGLVEQSPPPLPSDPVERNLESGSKKDKSELGSTNAATDATNITENSDAKKSSPSEKTENSFMKNEAETINKGVCREDKVNASNKVTVPVDNSTVVEKDTEISKPKKKPPVGGISMFGGGLLAGSELFAKVKQRKSMISPDSESEEEVDSIPGRDNMKSTETSSSKSGSLPSSDSVSPLSPLSPLSPVPPDSLATKPGVEDIGVSFDEPITSQSVLQSINKSRVRGSKKRRLPSRALRRGDASTSSSATVPSDPLEASNVTNPILVSDSKNERTSETHGVPNDSSADESNRLNNAQDHINETDREVKKGTEKVSNSPKRQNNLVVNDSEDSLFSTPKGISENKAKSSSSKKLNASQPTSLFGDKSDDDDDNLFGASKSKSVTRPRSKIETSPNTEKNLSDKIVAAPSLFGDDDDDDIFTASSKAKKQVSDVPKKGSSVVPATVKQKSATNIKPSNEPFVDPLMGGLNVHCYQSNKSSHLASPIWKRDRCIQSSKYTFACLEKWHTAEIFAAKFCAVAQFENRCFKSRDFLQDLSSPPVEY
ncbi:hypothetical protein SK128_006483 [Halocaridina rubra]|uniref:FAM21/CAPZIP domain-containing protein n=1 Tax=Halocaridina rubra TaxID=373956 RepID=A0AAN9A0T9_HALRR